MHAPAAAKIREEPTPGAAALKAVEQSAMPAKSQQRPGSHAEGVSGLAKTRSKPGGQMIAGMQAHSSL